LAAWQWPAAGPLAEWCSATQQELVQAAAQASLRASKASGVAKSAINTTMA